MIVVTSAPVVVMLVKIGLGFIASSVALDNTINVSLKGGVTSIMSPGDMRTTLLSDDNILPVPAFKPFTVVPDSIVCAHVVVPAVTWWMNFDMGWSQRCYLRLNYLYHL